jgi:TetR/AcrR family transcriptional regulator, cholesterol catabolism regulator
MIDDYTARREQVVRHAARLFEERGYHNTSVGDIAHSIGLRKPTLYHYVRSKAEILVLIHDDTIDPLLGRLEDNVASGVDPREGLRQVITDITNLMESKPGFLRVFFEHHREIPDPLRGEAERKRDRYQRLVESMIADGIRRGVFRDVPVRMSALALLGITNWSCQSYQPGGEFDPRRVANELLDLFLRGVEQHACG